MQKADECLKLATLPYHLQWFQADESAVLKHFDWPEKKADALREAAFEFRALKSLEDEVSCFKDDDSLACETTLKRVSSFLVK